MEIASAGPEQAALTPLPRSARPEPYVNVSEAERIASFAGGALLAIYGLGRRSPGGLLLAAIGGGLACIGATGHCPLYTAMDAATTGPHPGIHVDEVVTILQPREALFSYWHNFENLPHIMRHLKSVTVTDGGRSHWVARGPAGVSVEWDAQIYAEKKNALITWRTLDDSEIQHTGSVRFVRAPGGRGTEVRVSLEYRAPGGPTAAAVARLLGEEPHRQVHDDLRRFKQMMETGEIATTEGQPNGIRAAGRSGRRLSSDRT